MNRRMRKHVGQALGLLAVAGTLCLSGCKEVMLLGLILGGPPSIEPEFDAETGKALDLPDTTVAVICYASTDVRFANPNIDHELSQVVANQLFLNDIAVVRPDVVNAWLDEHPDYDHAEEVGAAMQADYVIEIELESFSLYEQNSAALFRGRTVSLVNVYEMDEMGHGERIFVKEIELVFPTEVPRSTYELPQAQFKQEFLSRLSDRIGWLFYERYSGDMIPWAT
jgi:hypothetical protein